MSPVDPRFAERRAAAEAEYSRRLRHEALRTYAQRVADEADRLLAEFPHLDTEGPRSLFSRLVTPETAPGFASCLRRAAFGVLLVRAMDQAELADPTTGDAA